MRYGVSLQGITLEKFQLASGKQFLALEVYFKGGICKREAVLSSEHKPKTDKLKLIQGSAAERTFPPIQGISPQRKVGGQESL